MEHEVLTLRAEGEEEEDDTEEESEDDEDDPAFIEVTRGLKNRAVFCLKSRPCTICLYLAIALVLLSSVVVLVIVGLLVVAPYHHVSDFVEVTCVTVHTVHDTPNRQCSCGKGCHSQYPCIHITVRLYPRTDSFQASDSQQNSSVILYEDESMLQRPCSFHPSCRSKSQENKAAVEDYVSRYGRKKRNFTCLSNPRRVSEVIRRRRFHIGHVTHGIVWPVLTLAVMTLCLLVTMYYRGCHLF